MKQKLAVVLGVVVGLFVIGRVARAVWRAV